MLWPFVNNQRTTLISTRILGPQICQKWCEIEYEEGTPPNGVLIKFSTSNSEVRVWELLPLWHESRQKRKMTPYLHTCWKSNCTPNSGVSFGNIRIPQIFVYSTRIAFVCVDLAKRPNIYPKVIWSWHQHAVRVQIMRNDKFGNPTFHIHTRTHANTHVYRYRYMCVHIYIYLNPSV